jgi:hypothetical protein
VDSTRSYKLILALSLTLSFPFVVGLAYNTQHRETWLYLCAAGMGFFGFPVLPVALDLSAEITYPIPADFTSALLWCGSQVCRLVLHAFSFLGKCRYRCHFWFLTSHQQCVSSQRSPFCTRATVPRQRFKVQPSK